MQVALVLHRNRSAIVFLSVAAAAIVLNPLHELGHYVAWLVTDIPSCLLYNVTPLMGSPSTDAKYIPGLIAGPLANLALGALFIGLYFLVPRAKLPAAILVATTWLLRPIMVVAWFIQAQFITPADMPDELHLFSNILANYGLPLATIGMYGLVFGHLAFFVPFWRRVKELPARDRWLMPLYVFFAGGVVLVLIKLFNIVAIQFIGPVGPLCDSYLDALYPSR